MWTGHADADTRSMRRLAVLPLAALVVATVVSTAAARPSAARSWATPQIAAVVNVGLMAPSVAEFRPDDPLTATEFATVLTSLGGSVAVDDPDRPVTMREFDAQLVTLVGLRPVAREIRLAALDAGLAPTSWLGTETVARILGLRVNHLRTEEELELQLAQPATRAEAAYSIARVLELDDGEVEAVRSAVAGFALPYLTEWQRTVLARALRFVGSPYVWAGSSERPQQLFGKQMPGGFDCSGFVWRVYKLEPFVEAPALAQVLRGRTSYAMSGEVLRSARLTRDLLQPGDVVFFGSRGPRSRPSEVGHMGIYVGSGWIVHSSRLGTTLTPMTGWHETSFAWGRSPLAEAGVS
jgi:cell wall-associated NlpC family hydrolase